MSLPRTALVPALLLLVPPLSSGATRPVVRFCLPQRQLAVMGVALGLPRDSVLLRLGAASPTEGSMLRYRDLEVTLGPDDRVSRLRPLTSRARGPGGVHLGQRLEDVIEQLGASLNDQDLDEVTWEPAICRDGALPTGPGLNASFTWENLPGEFGAMVTSYPNRRLASLELTRTTPGVP